MSSGSNQRVRTESITWRLTPKGKKLLKKRAKRLGFKSVQKYLDYLAFGTEFDTQMPQDGVN